MVSNESYFFRKSICGKNRCSHIKVRNLTLLFKDTQPALNPGGIKRKGFVSDKEV